MRIGIIGSGPAAAAAAAAALGAGHEVEMLDVGLGPEPESDELARRLREGPAGAEDLQVLKKGFGAAQPVPAGVRLRRLLTSVAQGVTGRSAPDLHWKKLFGSTYVFKDLDAYLPLARPRPQVPRSLAKGGLSNVWGAACYPFNGPDFRDWPVAESEMAEHFRAAAGLLQISESEDPLAGQYPVHGRPEPRLRLNPQTRDLLARWTGEREGLKRGGFTHGQARLAVLTRPRNGRDDCRYCGLCLYGCPHGSIYSSAFTVGEFAAHPRFRYAPGVFVRAFEEVGGGRVAVHGREVATGSPVRREYDRLLVGAGVLSTLRIVCDSLGEHSRSVSLLDNYMLLLPLLKASPWLDVDENVAFTLSQLVLVLDDPSVCEGRIHMQMYSYSDYIFDRFKPFLAPLPPPLRRFAQRCMYNTLIMFAYLDGRHSPVLRARVVRQAGDRPSLLDLERVHNEFTAPAVRRLFRHLARHRRSLGFRAITPAVKKTEPGFSGHLCGALPMRRSPGPLETHGNGLLYGCRSVYIVDQSTFPSLAAQNATYTAMANAHRIASQP